MQRCRVLAFSSAGICSDAIAKSFATAGDWSRVSASSVLSKRDPGGPSETHPASGPGRAVRVVVVAEHVLGSSESSGCPPILALVLVRVPVITYHGAPCSSTAGSTVAAMVVSPKKATTRRPTSSMTSGSVPSCFAVARVLVRERDELAWASVAAGRTQEGLVRGNSGAQGDASMGATA